MFGKENKFCFFLIINICQTFFCKYGKILNGMAQLGHKKWPETSDIFNGFIYDLLLQLFSKTLQMIPFLYQMDLNYQNVNTALNSLVYYMPSNQQRYYMFPYNPSFQNYCTFFQTNTEETHVNRFPRENQQAPAIETNRNGEIPVERKEQKQRKRNVEKQLESAKKNSESNIVNQLYSFFNNLQLSEKIVLRAIRSIKPKVHQIEKICSFFYKIIRVIIFKRGRKYVNKDSITNFYSSEYFKKQIPDIQETLEGHDINLQDLCTIFRITTYYFIKKESICAILTSKRITTRSKYEHLKRRRVVLESLESIEKS